MMGYQQVGRISAAHIAPIGGHLELGTKDRAFRFANTSNSFFHCSSA